MMKVCELISNAVVLAAISSGAGCGSTMSEPGQRGAQADTLEQDASTTQPSASDAAASEPAQPTASNEAHLLPKPSAEPTQASVPTSSADDDEVSSENACGSGSVSAELIPVNMLVMFDRSGSMNDDNKWQSATAALTSFFQDPSADGLHVALRFFPHDEPAAGCSEAACDAAACARPLVDIGGLTAQPAPMDGQEERLVQAIAGVSPGGGGGGRRGGGQGTPIYAALDGALQWAVAHESMHPDETTVVIFVTDGMPNGCDEDFDNIAALAADALTTTGVTTYAIGLQGSSEAQLDQLASAGGTGSGIFIGSGANAERELLAALNSIRGETLSCEFPIPAPMDATQEVDPDKLNVTFTRGNGQASTFRRVDAAGDCRDLGAWFYDSPSAPTRITLCPTACDAVQSEPSAGIEILIGCATCGGLDEACDEGTPPEVPPLF